MNKKLLKQIVNERRSNAWMLVELFLVSVVLWYVVDYTFVTFATYLEPRGFDITHTYRVEVGLLTEKSPDYLTDCSMERLHADMRELLDRLRRRSGVEAVSISQNSFPYNDSNNGNGLSLDSMERESTIWRQATPDFFRVFRYRGANGESPEQLTKLLTEGTFMASKNAFAPRYKVELKDLVGREFKLASDTTRTHQLAAALVDVRYSDFQQACYSRSVVTLLPSDQLAFGNELCLRTRDGEPSTFAETLMKEASQQYRVGNLFIAKVTPFDSIRRSFQLDDTNRMRDYFIGMGFLLVNIFLGLLGTFWFRTQQRRSEMALMMAMGSSKRGVFFRLLSEGLMLLILITPLALIVDYHIASAELTPFWNFSSFSIGRFAIGAGITFLLMALMILLGIWFPARKAMKIQPAEALHEE